MLAMDGFNLPNFNLEWSSLSEFEFLSDIGGSSDIKVEKENDAGMARLDTYNPKLSDISDSDNLLNTKSDDELVLSVSQIENSGTNVTENYSSKQFSEPVCESDLRSFSRSRLPANSIAKSNWAFRTFTNWRLHRNSIKKDWVKKFEGDILQMDNKSLNESLGYFIMEVRRQDGTEYQGDTIYELVVALQYYMRTHGKIVNLLDDIDFISMREILDAKLKQLAQSGSGLNKKSADIITEEYEEILWNNGFLGSETPKQLLDTLIYLLGLNFALRAGKEHRNLRVGERSQIQVCGETGAADCYLLYTEDVSKSNQGGLNHRKLTKKTVRAYQNNRNPERCPVLLFEKYLKLRPRNCKTDALYIQPKKFYCGNDWYTGKPIGLHTLQNVIKNMCLKAGLRGNFSNHSLRATAATRLYNAGIDDQLIREKTGHRSDAVKVYKRTSEEQLKNISDIIQNKRIKESNSDSCTDPKIDSSLKEINFEHGNLKLQFKF